VKASKDTVGPPNPVVGDDGDSLRRAAEELLRRGRAGIGMTQATARYRQFELAQLLGTVVRAIEGGEALPVELLRHAATLAGHILAYPAAAAEPSAVNTGQLERLHRPARRRRYPPPTRRPTRTPSGRWICGGGRRRTT